MEGLAEEKARFTVGGEQLSVKVLELIRSGLTVVHAACNGPLVRGAFAIATEPPDDSGLPHTLEHLIFLGSSSYPHKGILDLAANRSFAHGTNAWTAKDHTAYTIETAGPHGFVNVAPTLFDHIINPLLSTDGYITEVHHINGSAEDGGVVYNELLGRESAAEELSSLTLARAMFPNGCGYRYESGGTKEGVRNLCSPDRVRQYHQSMYHPAGVCLVLVGNISDEEMQQLLTRLDTVVPDEKLPRNQPRVAWTLPSPQLQSSEHRHVYFPSEDEDTGLVQIAWQLGPYKDFFILTAFNVLTDYLTDNSASPLQKEMIDLEEPYASEAAFSVQEYDTRVLELTFDSVPVSYLEEVERKAMQLMNDIASGNQTVNMQLIRTLIRKSRLDYLEKLENEPDEVVPDASIPHFIYGLHRSGWSQLETAFDEFSRLEQLTEKGPEFWQQLLREYIIERPKVTVVSHPSTQKGDAIQNEDHERFEARRTELGEDVLHKKQDEVEQAHARNDAPFDESYVTRFPVPSIDGIERHPASLYSVGPIQAGKRLPKGLSMPVPTLMSDVNSNFVTTGIVMRADNLTDRQRMMLPLLMECVFLTGIERSGNFIGHQQIAQEVADSSLSYSSNVGYREGSFFSSGGFTCASVEMRTDSSRYAKCVSLIADCLFRTRPMKDRLVAIAKKALNKAPKILREGEVIANDMLNQMNFGNESLHLCTCTVKQQNFLKGVLDQLRRGGAETVLGELHTLRRELLAPERVMLFVNGRLKDLGPQLLNQWREALEELDMRRVPSQPTMPQASSNFLSSAGAKGGDGMICGISSVESGYAEITTPTITSAEHMDVAPILVASELLQALEGPFWREIRGAGLAYGSHMRLKVEEGLLHFSLFRCNQVGKALAAAKGIVEEFAKEKREMRETDVENAVSSTVFSITAREQTPSDTGSSVLSTVLLQVPPEYNANLLERVREVDRSAVLDVMKRYMRALFEPKRSNVSVCCAPNKVDGTISEFAELGYNLAKYDSLMLAFGLQQKEEREQQRSQGGTQEAEQTQEGDDGKKQVPREQEEGASQSEGQVQQQGGAAEEVVQAMKEEEGDEGRW